MTLTQDQKSLFMQAALDESQKALPQCLPNPPVGCVIVQQGEIIAKGYTQAPGQAHAEAMALAQVKGSLADCEIFVSLEPCSFQGRTPSCAKSIAPRQPKAVHIAIVDPDPRNQGKGIAILLESGIEVNIGLLAKEVEAFLSPYLNLLENRI